MMDAWAIRHHPCDAPRRSPGLAANKKAARRFRRVTKRGTNPQHLTAPGHIGLWPMWGPYSGWNGSTSSGIWQRLRMSKPNGSKPMFRYSGHNRADSTCPSLKYGNAVQ